MSARAEESPATDSIHGRVVDVDGQGLAGVRLYGYTRGVEQREAVTDDDGSFSIDGLAQHDWWLGCNEDGYLGTTVGRSTLSSGEVRVVMHLAGRLSGQLTSEDGRPVKGLDFAFFPHNATLAGQRDSPERVQHTDGGYIASGLSPGRFRVLVNARGYLPLTVDDVEITSGKTTDLNLLFRTGSSLSGRAVGGGEDRVALVRLH